MSVAYFFLYTPVVDFVFAFFSFFTFFYFFLSTELFFCVRFFHGKFELCMKFTLHCTFFDFLPYTHFFHGQLDRENVQGGLRFCSCCVKSTYAKNLTSVLI